jgi:hypothetical protein
VKNTQKLRLQFEACCVIQDNDWECPICDQSAPSSLLDFVEPVYEHVDVFCPLSNTYSCWRSTLRFVNIDTVKQNTKWRPFAKNIHMSLSCSDIAPGLFMRNDPPFVLQVNYN